MGNETGEYSKRERVIGQQILLLKKPLKWKRETTKTKERFSKQNEKLQLEKMKKLIPDFTSKDFWLNLLLGAITFSILWWFGIIQWAFELGAKFGYWFANLILWKNFTTTLKSSSVSERTGNSG